MEQSRQGDLPNKLGEAAKIVLLCVGASIVYGIGHDQITARVYLPYFTEWHPKIVDSNDPTVLAFVWGVVATWWVGLILSVGLCFAALAGNQPTFPFRKLTKLVLLLLLVMGIAAASTGIASYFLELQAPEFSVQKNGPFPTDEQLRLFTAVWLTHSTSYVVGGLGGIALCFITFLSRQKAASES